MMMVVIVTVMVMMIVVMMIIPMMNVNHVDSEPGEASKQEQTRAGKSKHEQTRAGKSRQEQTSADKSRQEQTRVLCARDLFRGPECSSQKGEWSDASGPVVQAVDQHTVNGVAADGGSIHTSALRPSLGPEENRSAI
jgi:mannitol-specific phosphotransferase system IIBC component